MGRTFTTSGDVTAESSDVAASCGQLAVAAACAGVLTVSALAVLVRSWSILPLLELAMLGLLLVLGAAVAWCTSVSFARRLAGRDPMTDPARSGLGAPRFRLD